MKAKGKRSTLTNLGIVIWIALIEVNIVRLFLKLGWAPDGKINASLSMLLTIISYLAISGILVLVKKFRKAMWVAIYSFVFLCIFLFYSETIVDILTFIVLLFGLLCSMTVLNDLIKLQEGK